MGTVVNKTCLEEFGKSIQLKVEESLKRHNGKWNWKAQNKTLVADPRCQVMAFKWKEHIDAFWELPEQNNQGLLGSVIEKELQE